LDLQIVISIHAQFPRDGYHSVQYVLSLRCSPKMFHTETFDPTPLKAGLAGSRLLGGGSLWYRTDCGAVQSTDCVVRCCPFSCTGSAGENAWVYVWLECSYDLPKATLDSLGTLRYLYPIDVLHLNWDGMGHISSILQICT
jgi:hypothetical protein